MQGYLIPRFHKNYWMSMTANVVKNFTNIDITLPCLDSGRAYVHWNVYMWVAGRGALRVAVVYVGVDFSVSSVSVFPVFRCGTLSP